MGLDARPSSVPSGPDPKPAPPGCRPLAALQDGLLTDSGRGFVRDA
ncbi:hypothetical protein KNP414_05898 [Paenibacillus mucilaginosus KNP414]|uniref:Uncharacterized protein n=1 Tax=Paenibacillus mucilaginosus (strain KNP414) TaxID=1036673 RepID=F8F9U3_PAEMK|nr:hypothetical protein KNP414_05898 [Paenibacillus mucilaginosus KNP414]